MQMLVKLCLLLSLFIPAQGQDSRLIELISTVDVTTPNWIRDDDLGPGAIASWETSYQTNDIARVVLQGSAMGTDVEELTQAMKIAFPSAKVVGTPRTLVTASAIELQVFYQISEQEYCFIWEQILGLSGKTALSPTLFSFMKSGTLPLDEFQKTVQGKQQLLQPAFSAHVNYAYRLRVRAQDNVVRMQTGMDSKLEFPLPAKCKQTEETQAAAEWTCGSQGTLELTVHSSLLRSAASTLESAVAEVSDVTRSKDDPNDVTFVSGEHWTRLKVLENGGYVIVLKATASGAKPGDFDNAVAATFNRSEIVTVKK